jgi:hypothetical protein
MRLFRVADSDIPGVGLARVVQESGHVAVIAHGRFARDQWSGNVSEIIL